MRLTRSSVAAMVVATIVVAAAHVTGRLSPASRVSPTPEELAEFFDVFAGAGGQRPAAAVVKRILALDANGDTHVSRDELPERMHVLVEHGDLNGDRVLTAQEIERLVHLPPASPRTRTSLPARKRPVTMADVIRDLRLPQPKQDRAMAIAKDYVSGVPDGRLRKLLDDEEYENFVASANRLNSRRGMAD